MPAPVPSGTETAFAEVSTESDVASSIKFDQATFRLRLATTAPGRKRTLERLGGWHGRLPAGTYKDSIAVELSF